MGFEILKPAKSFSKDEEKKLTKSRYQSDAELMEVDDNLNLVVSERQVDTARQMMEEEKGHYMDRVTINGKEISVAWHDDYRDYTIYFPQIKLGEEAYEKGVYDQILRISKDSKTAKKVFDFAGQEAQKENDVYDLFIKTQNFIFNMPEDIAVGDDLSLAVSERQVDTAKQMVEEEKGDYRDKITINGKEISVAWDMFDDEYTIFFPQINDNENARKNGIYQPIIKIGKDSENAKKAFIFAGQQAKDESDICQLYKKVEDFIHELRHSEYA